MKHYVVQSDCTNTTEADDLVPQRTQHIDVILRCHDDKASTEAIVEFYRALNRLIGKQTYLVNIRVIAEERSGGPLYWAGRTAVFWGDFDNAWTLNDAERTIVSQILNLASRSVLVGSAVLLLARAGGSSRTEAAIHPNFRAGALELGLGNSGTATHLASESRVHSANSRLSALRLMAKLVALDHGEHLADSLRRYIGLVEPNRQSESQVANRLVRRAHGDELVTLAVEKMLENIEEPLRISELSNRIGISVRQLQRRYLRKTNTKLLDTYKELRLERVNTLLECTDMPFWEVATATGFSSRVAMSRAFLKHYGSRPDEIRSQRYLGRDVANGSPF